MEKKQLTVRDTFLLIITLCDEGLLPKEMGRRHHQNAYFNQIKNLAEQWAEKPLIVVDSP